MTIDPIKPETSAKLDECFSEIFGYPVKHESISFSERDEGRIDFVQIEFRSLPTVSGKLVKRLLDAFWNGLTSAGQR